MAVGIKNDEPDARVIYADIIDLPAFHVEGKPYMTPLSRASQFSSFDALEGYAEMIAEEEREVGSFETLSETEIEQLNIKMTIIADAIEDGHEPIVCFTYFIEDARKNGGSYVSITERVRRVDMIGRKIQLFKRVGVSGSYMKLDMDKIHDISGDIVDSMDNFES